MLLANSNYASLHLNKCGTLSPAINLIIEENEINNWLEENANNIDRNNLNIPIAFHIIYENFSSNGGYIEESSINSQVDVLNNAFNSTNITFSLYSINYIENSNWYNDDDEYTYKQELSITPDQILNIYTTTAGGYLGYAYFPNQWSENSYMHGVVLNSTTFPGGDWPYDQGDTAVHEVGHYLGLYHTFQDGCSENGDYISDTPSQNDGENIYYCNESLDTCDTPGTDPIHNYMNYTDDECLTEFSYGQIDRMNFMIETYKPNLGCSIGYDCAGICGGSAQDLGCGCGEEGPSGCDETCGSTLEFDECGVCGGEGITDDTCDCDGNVEDCAGDCGGNAAEDNCGTCDSNSDNDCAADCNGEFGGSAEIDECGVCGGGGIADGTCDCDGNVDLGCGCGETGPSGCDETCGSTLEFDDCGTCNGPGLDCGGSCNNENIELWGECYNIQETTTLSLTDNNLSGEIPSEIGLLTNLFYLTLYGNQLSGEIPSEIGNLTNLISLYLSDNMLTGEIPQTVENLINLEVLYLDENNLNGSIPNIISNLFNLKYLSLSGNNLDGQIPNEIGNLSNLIELSLSRNELSDTIPGEIENLSNLEVLYLNDNELSGEISFDFNQLGNLQRINLWHNNLSGLFPESICDLSLNEFHITDNNFCPPYPECLSEEEIGYQNTSECEENLLGDINGDGVINVSDIVIIIDWILNGGTNNSGDINQDNSINVSDVVLLVYIILNT